MSLFNRCSHQWEVLDKTILPSAFESAKMDPCQFQKEMNDFLLKKYEPHETSTHISELDSTPYTNVFEKTLVIVLKCAFCPETKIEKTTVGSP